MLPTLIILQWTFLIIACVIDVSFPDIVYPPELKAFLDSEDKKDPTPLFIGIAITSILLYIISCVGLWKLKKWGFALYIIAQALCLACYPMIGYNLTSGYGGIFYEMSFMVIGATILFGYLKIWQTV